MEVLDYFVEAALAEEEARADCAEVVSVLCVLPLGFALSHSLLDAVSSRPLFVCQRAGLDHANGPRLEHSLAFGSALTALKMKCFLYLHHHARAHGDINLPTDYLLGESDHCLIWELYTSLP